CRFGHIFPWGGRKLAFSSNARGAVAKRVVQLDRTAVDQDGSDGITVTFDVDDFAKLASIVKPRTRRQLTPEQKAAAVARLAKFRVPSAQSDFGRRQSDALGNPAP